MYVLLNGDSIEALTEPRVKYENNLLVPLVLSVAFCIN